MTENSSLFPSDPSEDQLRAFALKRVKDRRDFVTHLITYVTVNAFIVAIWAVVGGGFFWPMFPLFGWGIGIALHAWEVYGPMPDEASVAKEMDRLRHRHA